MAGAGEPEVKEDVVHVGLLDSAVQMLRQSNGEAVEESHGQVLQRELRVRVFDRRKEVGERPGQFLLRELQGVGAGYVHGARKVDQHGDEVVGRGEVGVVLFHLGERVLDVLFDQHRQDVREETDHQFGFLGMAAKK